MHCSGCAQRIDRVLTDLEGIRSADVSLDEEQAVVQYDGDQIDYEQIRNAIEKAGYETE